MTARPEPFGYKIGWIALRSTDPGAVARALRLSNCQETDWNDGIHAVYDRANRDLVFVTPAIRGWVLVVGPAVMGLGDQHSVETIERMLCQLSLRFGEAQSFATHRVIEYHHWITVIAGSVQRSFAYLGESGEILSNAGELTDAERSLGWPVSFEERPRLPNEADVMNVAGRWSIDPTTISSEDNGQRTGITAVIPNLEVVATG